METVSVKVPNDIKKMLDQYCEENDISQSEAVRRLLLDGLRDDQDLLSEVRDLHTSITCLQGDLEGATLNQRLGAIESSLQSLEERINNE